FVVLLLLAIGVSASAQLQPEYTFLADYGDGSVQTFLAGETGSISGVRLVIRAHGHGADVTVRLYDNPNDILPADFRTQGVLGAAAIPAERETWLLIPFDTPQLVTAGDSLALNINQF